MDKTLLQMEKTCNELFAKMQQNDNTTPSKNDLDTLKYIISLLDRKNTRK